MAGLQRGEELMLSSIYTCWSQLSVSKVGTGGSFWSRDDLAAGAAHVLCNAQSGAAQRPRARLDTEQRMLEGMAWVQEPAHASRSWAGGTNTQSFKLMQKH